MRPRFAILCPGQGGQHAGMFDALRVNPLAAAFLDRCGLEKKLGSPMSSLLDGERLYANAVAQPLVVAATLAAWAGIRDAVPTPDIAAGYSVGEIATCAVADALAPEAAVDLAAARAQAMDRCVRDKPAQALIALSGLSAGQMALLCSSLPLYRAIENGDDHLIAGCEEAALPRITSAVQAAGGRVQRLPVGLASHTPLLAEAVPVFAGILGEASVSSPCGRHLSGVSAEPVYDKTALIDQLARQIAEPIRWAQCMDVMAEMGVGVALELGPGGALARMLRERHPHIACRSIDDFRSIEGAAAWAVRMQKD